jgi:hypothetical protein
MRHTEAYIQSTGHSIQRCCAEPYTRLLLQRFTTRGHRPCTASEYCTVQRQNNIMSSKPHSKTVRGTLDNPKTQAAIKSGTNPPRLGDHVSLKPENDNPPTPENQKSNASSDSAPTVSDPYRKNEATSSSKQDKSLPHSKTVRGTLANTDGKQVNRTQLGDPASLKAETSESKMSKGVEREGQEKGGKSKL